MSVISVARVRASLMSLIREFKGATSRSGSSFAASSLALLALYNIVATFKSSLTARPSAA